jgi:ribonuclease HII
LNATFGAMHKALDILQVRPELILVDGSHFKPYTFDGVWMVEENKF